MFEYIMNDGKYDGVHVYSVRFNMGLDGYFAVRKIKKS
jgi:hypothetical protein